MCVAWDLESVKGKERREGEEREEKKTNKEMAVILRRGLWGLVFLFVSFILQELTVEMLVSPQHQLVEGYFKLIGLIF